jgi:hypothetical protein
MVQVSSCGKFSYINEITNGVSLDLSYEISYYMECNEGNKLFAYQTEQNIPENLSSREAYKWLVANGEKLCAIDYL